MVLFRATFYRTLQHACPFFFPQQGKSVSTLAADTSRHLLVCFLWVMKNADRGLIQRWTVEMPPSQLNKLLELLTICVSCFEYKVCLQLYLLLQNSRFYVYINTDGWERWNLHVCLCILSCILPVIVAYLLENIQPGCMLCHFFECAFCRVSRAPTR